MTIRNRQAIVLESRDISFNRLSYIGDSCLFALSLADAPRQAWALGNPIAVFTRMENYLTHGFTLASLDWEVFS